MTKEEILEAIEKMSVTDLVELVKALEEKFGVSGMPMALPVAGGGGGQQAAQEEEKTTFGVSLKEANELCKDVPKTVKKGVSQEEAEEIKNKLSAVGATVEIK